MFLKNDVKIMLLFSVGLSVCPPKALISEYLPGDDEASVNILVSQAASMQAVKFDDEIEACPILALLLPGAASKVAEDTHIKMESDDELDMSDYASSVSSNVLDTETGSASASTFPRMFFSDSEVTDLCKYILNPFGEIMYETAEDELVIHTLNPQQFLRLEALQQNFLSKKPFLPIKALARMSGVNKLLNKLIQPFLAISKLVGENEILLDANGKLTSLHAHNARLLSYSNEEYVFRWAAKSTKKTYYKRMKAIEQSGFVSDESFYSFRRAYNMDVDCDRRLKAILDLYKTNKKAAISCLLAFVTNNYALLDTANTLAKLGEKSKAIRAYKKIVMNTENGYSKFEAAKALEKLGATAQAIRMYLFIATASKSYAYYRLEAADALVKLEVQAEVIDIYEDIINDTNINESDKAKAREALEALLAQISSAAAAASAS